MLGWHVDSVVKCGLAGTIFFTWTDEWFTGGQEITDWAFGIVTRDRKPKKAFYTLREKLGQTIRLCRIAVAADAVRFGHCLFVQRGKNACGVPRFVRQTQLSRLRSDSGR